MRVLKVELDVMRPWDRVEKREVEGQPEIHTLTRNGSVVEAWHVRTGEYWIAR